ncbi:hypothetical protein Pint_27758 [Pistacia integerrima]|uniref:Uncharacterized protein n=1 Tax=Pistacia integerrima TaxID=434235 RepID=A0ACC0YUH8_9ROSI|nr:hypothetical protein Pint_27758 [Pistacia integerrima]
MVHSIQGTIRLTRPVGYCYQWLCGSYSERRRGVHSKIEEYSEGSTQKRQKGFFPPLSRIGG